MENSSFKVRTVIGTPEFDAMPVAKIIDYPLEKRDYRPFAQNIICVSEGALFIRMWAFEASPAPSSELRGVFRLFADKPQTALHVQIYLTEESAAIPQCRVSLQSDGEDLPLDIEYELKAHSGEDLQGIFWGAVITIKLSVLEAAAGKTLTVAGDAFSGNFYKLCSDEKYNHYGSFYPANFAGNPYSSESMGDFEVVGW